jgi:hypothetical protein
VLGTLDKGDLVLTGSQIVNKNLTVQTGGQRRPVLLLAGRGVEHQHDGYGGRQLPARAENVLRPLRQPPGGQHLQAERPGGGQDHAGDHRRLDVENVVITDMLPAGFEIENPRISEMAEMTWAEKAAHPEHFDVRDDRINLFATATDNPRSYYYVVRAVSTGTFRMGP